MPADAEPLARIRHALEESRAAFHDPESPEGDQCAGYRLCSEALAALGEVERGAEKLWRTVPYCGSSLLMTEDSMKHYRAYSGRSAEEIERVLVLPLPKED